MNTRHLLACAGVATLWLAALAAAQQDDEPRDVGLTEEARRRLAQLDVTIRGPQEIVDSLTRDDFELTVMGRPVEEFSVDRICREPESTKNDPIVAADAAGLNAEATTAAPDDNNKAIGTAVVSTRTMPATFLFYFDQAFLTVEGRVRSMDTARDLIRRLIKDGSRATVVSSGQVLITYTPLTDDVDSLLAAVDSIGKDPRQWDPSAASEEDKLQAVLSVMTASGTAAMARAQKFQRAEVFASERAMRRLSMVLGRMIELEPPKAAIYFADRMRSQPGKHYLSLFGPQVIRNHVEVSAMWAQYTFDQVVDEANAHSIRFYAIQAEGMQAPPLVASPFPGAGHTTHIRAAQDSLRSLSLETGGQAFLNGTRPKKIARHIEKDLSCVHLISFDPSGFPQDSGLAVRVRVKRAGVTVQVRGQTVFQSDEARKTARLMAGFAAPGMLADDVAPTASLIPLGYDDGKYTGLVQIVVPGSPLANASWDVGASLVAGGSVRDETSRRIELSTPGTPIVLEAEMRFGPGRYELIFVAHEVLTDRVISGQLAGEWPDPNSAEATVGPIAVVQPEDGAFVRGDEVRARGSLSRDGDEILASRPTALIGLICRARRQRAPLSVRRRLIGESSVQFDPIELDLGEERCAQIRDVIEAGVMTGGTFEYEVSVLIKDRQVATRSRVLAAAESP